MQFLLDDKEIEEIEFSSRFICDRLERPGHWKAGKTYEEAYGYGRIDMFWIECSYDGLDLGSLCVEPNLCQPDKFYIAANYCKVVNIQAVKDRATKWFITTNEYTKMVELVKILMKKIEEDKNLGRDRSWKREVSNN